MSEENVAIVKSSWAGWRQGLEAQWVRDFEDGVMERMAGWSESTGAPDLQPEGFVDCGETVLVHARDLSRSQDLWFRYTLEGARIVGWDVHESEADARDAAGV
jgi:hypothetical protein